MPPIVPSAVFVARDADQMNGVYEGQEQGFTYAREGSPNAELLAAKIAALEGAECGLITSSGMSAVAAILLGLLKAGDHVVAGNQLYGRTLRLVSQELPRLGFATDLVDATDVAAVERAIRPNTRMMLVEVVSNPLLRVADIAALGALARSRGVLLVVDNTFPTPLALRPLSLGARHRVSQHHEDARRAQRRDARRRLRLARADDADSRRDRHVGPERQPVRLLARRARHEHARAPRRARQRQCGGAGGAARRPAGSPHSIC